MTGPGNPDPGGGTPGNGDGNNTDGKQWKTYEYEHTDMGPYRLIIQLIDTRDDTHINKLSVGKLLAKSKEYKANVLNLKTMGKNKVLVLVKTPLVANKIQADKTLKEHNYNAYIPKHFLTVSGVVTGVPLEMTTEEILENITCKVPILSVTRLHRFEQDRKVPTTRIGVTFRANQIPTEVRMFCCTNEVKPFISKVVFCQNCLRYSHRTNNCRSRQRCGTCAQQHEEQGYGQCKAPASCLHCKKEGHKSGDPNCPERTRQNNLKVILAKTNLTTLEAQEQYPIYTQNRFSLLESIEEYPTLTNSYAQVSQSKSVPNNRSNHTARQWQTERTRQQQTPKRTSAESTNTVIGNQIGVYQDKKRKTDDETTTNGVALFNRYKVDEFEKFQWKLNQQKEADMKAHRTAQHDNGGNNMEVVSDSVDGAYGPLIGNVSGQIQVSQSDGNNVRQGGLEQT